MTLSLPRTKIVATIGPASASLETIQQMVRAGMSVARLNFSHGSYDDHARTIALLRDVSQALDTPITLLQDLQGPKIRVGHLPQDSLHLVEGQCYRLVPLADLADLAELAGELIPIDYPDLAEDAEAGMQVLLDDGLLELQVEAVEGKAVHCRVLEGGLLKSRKGVNFPSLTLRLPSLTEKDCQDLAFGLEQGVDWVSLSFVRNAADICALKQLLAQHGASDTPAIAKIEKPQAIENLDAILAECDGVMVARGDLGVEMKPERVPLLQKQIIRQCNQLGIPVITATQMLESMIDNPRPTRAEASDVANAIIDGTDAVMLSGESAVGKFPVKAVEMLGRIARDIEPSLSFTNYPPATTDKTHALSEALNTLDQVLSLRCIVAFTSSGYTALMAAAERPQALVVALTPSSKVYHRLNLVWGVRPILLEQDVATFEEIVAVADTCLQQQGIAQIGDQILILGGIPTGLARGTNFLKIHTIST